jgi:arginase
MFGIKDCHKPRKNTKKIYLAKKKALTRKHVIGKSGKRKNSRFPHIILFPSALGQERKGVEEAPEYLRDFINKKITIVDDTGDLHKNIVNLYLANEKTKGKRINVGGDHSMAIATIADTLNRYPDAKVIYFDAHADINTYKSSASKHVHGMPLAFLTGLDKHRSFSFIKNKLPFANLLYVGSRCWDTFEMDEIYKKNILFITPEEFNRPGKEIENALLNFVGDSPLHISFDVDSVDPKYISSTGTPVKGGILLEKAKKVLDLLDKRANIVNMDITEWNPHIGTKKQRQKSEVNTTYLFSRFLRK